MGLRNHGLDGPTFQMREKVSAIGDDFGIEDADSHRVFRVDGNAVRLRDTFIRDKMTIEGGEGQKAHGTIVDHEYEYERGGHRIAEVPKKWCCVRDTYGVPLAQGQGVPLILAVGVSGSDGARPGTWQLATSAGSTKVACSGQGIG